MNLNLVLKFGGSAITNKDQLETLRPEALRNACQLVKSCIDRGISCAIVHGAGSFGHHQAKEYGVKDGWTNIDTDDRDEINRVKTGMCLTRQSVTKLHHLVVDALLHEGIAAVGIPGYGIWETDNRIVTEHGIKSVTSTLHQGLVPVLHGDVVLDNIFLSVGGIFKLELRGFDLPLMLCRPTLQGYGIWETDKRTVTKHGMKSVTSTLEEGLVPVLHGDVVLDSSLACTILSGDTIIQTICEECSVDRVVFLTSVDGVYDKPPNTCSGVSHLQDLNHHMQNLPKIKNDFYPVYIDAKLLKEISVNYKGEMIQTLSKKNETDDHAAPENSSCCEGQIVSGAACNDVTGGMTLKLKTAQNIVSRSKGRTSVFICKIGSSYANDVCIYGHSRNDESTGTALTYN